MRWQSVVWCLTLAVAVSAVELASPENQKNWRFHEAGPALGPAGVTIPFDGEKVQTVVSGLDVKQGESCLLMMAYRLTKDSKLFFYVENHTPPNWQNKALNLTGTGGWKMASLRFKFDKPVKGHSYVGMRLTGKGALDVKSLFLVKGAENMSGQFFNADFAQGQAGWLLEENAQIVDGAAGGKALELWAKTEGESACARSSAVPVKPLQNYRLSFKATALAGFGKKSIEHDLRMYPLDKRGEPLTGSDKWLTALDGRTQTKHVEFKVPSRHTEITFVMEARGPARVQLAEFALEEIKPLGMVAEIQLDMPFNYRDGVFATNPASQITGNVVVFDPSASSVDLSLSDGEVSWEPKPDGKGGRFAVPAPAPGKTSNLALTVKDVGGKILHQEQKVLHHYPANPVEVTFNEDGVTLVNGQPFFHIGNWWFTNRGDRDEDMEFLKEAGFNVIFLPRDDPERFPLLEICRRHGVYGIVELPHRYPDDCKTPEKRKAFKDKWTGMIQKHQNHPSLFGYFGPDEPMLAGYQIETMSEFYHWARDYDPYHPLWVNEAPCGLVSELTAYARDTCDVFGVDIYPIGANHGSDLGDRSMTVVGLHTDRCVQAVEGRRPVWMILQGFSWAHMRKPARFQPVTEVPEALYPTYEQTRFMTFESILHGATGVQFHYLGYTVNVPDDFWRGIRRTTLELKYLTPVLTAKNNREAKAKCASPKVRMMVKTLKDANYYILANESPETVIAAFSDFPEKQLNVIFQEEPIAVRDGKFELILEPYAVRVMSEAAFAAASVIWQADTYRPYSDRLKDDVRK
ncbi:MAG: hypothetical protein IJJ33_12895 [Victivallales bacterium]|nr:hypothetical protein [Victivallales bacterium]